MKRLEMPRGLRLVAEQDGIGHLVPTRGRARRSCDQRFIDERHGYPVLVRCPDCTSAALGKEAVSTHS